MKTVADIDKQIALLKKEREELQREAEKEGREAWKNIQTEWIWYAEWLSEWVVRISCQRSQKTIDEMNAHYEKYGSIPMASRDLGRKEGMNHMLIGNHIISTGGGSVVTSIDRGSFLHPQPHLLTDEEVEELRQGKVPESIRAPWDK